MPGAPVSNSQKNIVKQHVTISRVVRHRGSARRRDTRGCNIPCPDRDKNNAHKPAVVLASYFSLTGYPSRALGEQTQVSRKLSREELLQQQRGGMPLLK